MLKQKVSGNFFKASCAETEALEFPEIQLIDSEWLENELDELIHRRFI